MVSTETFRTLALALDNVQEQPHFEKTSFRVKKKIFATLDVPGKKAVLRLSEIDQSVFCAYNAAFIYPVAGTWGQQGWTVVELAKIPKPMLTDALALAYQFVAGKS